jgi:signal transduction histidine kinase
MRSCPGTPSAPVRADALRLDHVLSRLLDNSVRYSTDGGEIDVALSLHGGAAEVSVRDHGVGIPR